MIIALTGTPGTGKTSISLKLKDKGFLIIDLNQLAIDKNFILGKDEIRDSKIIDINKLNKYVFKNFKNKDMTIVEGHISHLLSCCDIVLILRCHPKKLRINLTKKGWNENKIKENLEAEILDIILCEAIDNHSKDNIFEINVTNNSLDKSVTLIENIINNNFKNMKTYKIGKIDWSEEILKDF
jgi:adenylate kinase